MSGDAEQRSGAKVVRGALRFLGSMTRNLCEGVYFFFPFIRPKNRETHSQSSPSDPKPFVSTSQRREEMPHSAKIEPSLKQDFETKKPSCVLSNVLEAIKPAAREKAEEKRSETKPDVRPIDGDAFLKGIRFHDKSEAVRSEIYTKDFNSGSPRMRRDALAQIEQLPKPLALEVLKRLLEVQKDALIEMELLDALAGLIDDGEPDKHVFKRYLRSENSILRLAAVRAISKYKDEESFSILSSALHDGDPEIRKRALSSLLWSFEKRCVPAVMHALGDSDPHVRKAAASICGVLKLRQSISALISMLGDLEREVQKAANESLKKITEEDFDFHPNSSPTNKKEAVEAWRYWWRDHQVSFGLQVAHRT